MSLIDYPVISIDSEPSPASYTALPYKHITLYSSLNYINPSQVKVCSRAKRHKTYVVISLWCAVCWQTGFISFFSRFPFNFHKIVCFKGHYKQKQTTYFLFCVHLQCVWIRSHGYQVKYARCARASQWCRWQLAIERAATIGPRALYRA